MTTRIAVGIFSDMDVFLFLLSETLQVLCSFFYKMKCFYGFSVSSFSAEFIQDTGCACFCNEEQYLQLASLVSKTDGWIRIAIGADFLLRKSLDRPHSYDILCSPRVSFCIRNVF